MAEDVKVQIGAHVVPVNHYRLRIDSGVSGEIEDIKFSVSHNVSGETIFEFEKPLNKTIEFSLQDMLVEAYKIAKEANNV